jgi:hypothetical protein
LRELRDLFQLGHLFFVQPIHLVGAFVDRALALVEVLVALFDLVGAAVEFGTAFIQPLRFLAQLDALSRAWVSIRRACSLATRRILSALSCWLFRARSFW